MRLLEYKAYASSFPGGILICSEWWQALGEPEHLFSDVLSDLNHCDPTQAVRLSVIRTAFHARDIESVWIQDHHSFGAVDEGLKVHRNQLSKLGEVAGLLVAHIVVCEIAGNGWPDTSGNSLLRPFRRYDVCEPGAVTTGYVEGDHLDSLG